MPHGRQFLSKQTARSTNRDIPGNAHNSQSDVSWHIDGSGSPGTCAIPNAAGCGSRNKSCLWSINTILRWNIPLPANVCAPHPCFALPGIPGIPRNSNHKMPIHSSSFSYGLSTIDVKRRFEQSSQRFFKLGKKFPCRRMVFLNRIEFPERVIPDSS